MKTPNCASCSFKAAERICRVEEGKFPDSCPTKNLPELIEKSLQEYQSNPELFEFARQSSIQEAEGYQNRDLGYAQVRAAKTRIEEIIGFANKMGYKRLGIAFCLGLRKEAKIVEKIFSENGFEIVSAICKAGRIAKDQIGVRPDQQVAPGTVETMCNPILQAMILNHHKTEFNILLGLCVGHDSLFLKHIEGYTTVLAVKDRVLAHNPMAAIYTCQTYYRWLHASEAEPRSEPGSGS